MSYDDNLATFEGGAARVTCLTSVAEGWSVDACVALVEAGEGAVRVWGREGGRQEPAALLLLYEGLFYGAPDGVLLICSLHMIGTVWALGGSCFMLLRRAENIEECFSSLFI